MNGAHAARARVSVNFIKQSANIHYSRMSNAHAASRIQSNRVIGGSCGTFPCVFMLLQILTGVLPSIARSCALRPYLGPV